jgi:hypothetical protein
MVVATCGRSTSFLLTTALPLPSRHRAALIVPDGLQFFVLDLMKIGIRKDEIIKMGREVTGQLLMG